MIPLQTGQAQAALLFAIRFTATAMVQAVLETIYLQQQAQDGMLLLALTNAEAVIITRLNMQVPAQALEGQTHIIIQPASWAKKAVI
jgi:hypothetical protein